MDAVLPTTCDAFLGGALMLLQPARGYRAGLDAVLLAAGAPLPEAHSGRTLRVLDAGAGVGAVGLCLARRREDVHVTLVERDADLAELARRNIIANGLEARAEVVDADLTRPLSQIADLASRAGAFDVVLANPPYHDADAGTRAPDRHKAASHAMPAGELERWFRFLASMAAADGALGLIHRAEALPAILAAAERRFGALTLRPLHPAVGAPANRVLVTARKGSRAPLTLSPGLVLHGPDGTFLPAIDAVLRSGARLPPP